MKLARVSRPDKVARSTGEVARRTCEAGKKVSSHGLADPARWQEARARWLGELAVQESNLPRESKLARVSGPGKVARGTSEVARRTCGARKKVSSHGLADPARWQEARARWLGELAVQESNLPRESKLARVSGPGKVARGTSEVARRTCGARKKVSSHGLADPARWQEARARWLGELAVQESNLPRESKLARVSGPGKVARGTSEVARRTCGARKKVSSHGLADPARWQEARARWLGELAVQESNLPRESKLARVSGPGKVARGTSEVARRTCGARKKVSSHGLADPARWQEARARWLGELAVQESNLPRESKLARVSGPGKVARGTSEVARRTCGARKKVSSHGLADPARWQEARARWLGELAVQESNLPRESKLARVSGPGKVARGTSEVARRTCGARKKVSSHGLADPARWQEARARWLGELAVQESNLPRESKLARVSGPGKVARGTSEVARRTCGARKKVSSHGLADPARWQEARARWLGELAVQESNLPRVSRPSKVAKGRRVVAR
ncbi:hypothetical protein CRG98_016674 [Punica granatum]|uniref:Uncharacterized protein n=1 Tax=Punica granatum TaxID=22663 RepID=A0A2I0K301_PUNGR|nr:hypothetical protein CRG98_016674 [Punica granatum]